MRRFLTIGVVLIFFTAAAMSPDYDSSREYIEQQNPKDKTPAAKRLFIGYSADSTNGTTILRFHKGMGLREIIDLTPLRGSPVTVYVLRPTQRTQSAFDGEVAPQAKPDFEVLPRDLLFLNGPSMLPRW